VPVSMGTSVASVQGQCAGLVTLDLSHNSIPTLPPAIGLLSGVMPSHPMGWVELNDACGALGLGDSTLNTDSLPGLRVLRLAGNPLGHLPECVFALLSLEVLDASRCQLTRVGAAIGCLTALRELRLGDNMLQRLPGDIGNLR
jgi:Leucine-rich repeat (LRR) protein